MTTLELVQTGVGLAKGTMMQALKACKKMKLTDQQSRSVMGGYYLARSGRIKR